MLKAQNIISRKFPFNFFAIESFNGIPNCLDTSIHLKSVGSFYTSLGHDVFDLSYLTFFSLPNTTTYLSSRIIIDHT